MSRDARYQRLLNSKRWQQVKTIVWRRAGGLCERCKAEGFITQGRDCHHVRPVENSKDLAEMEELAYNVNNIELLCVPCHIKVHQSMRSHSAEYVADNKKRGAERRAALLDPNYEANQPDSKPPIPPIFPRSD